MNPRCLAGVGIALFSLIVSPAFPQDKKGPDKLDPKDVALRLTLKSVKEAYELNLGGKTGKEFLAELDKALKAGGRIAEPPAVELVVEVTNTGKEKIDFWVSGDPVVLQLDLKGSGAKTVQPPLAFTADFRMPNFLSLEPGKSHQIKLNSLKSGFRGDSVWHYWTEPGEYTLTAHLQTGVRPVPKGVKGVYGGARVTLSSKEIKVQVK